MYYYIFSYLNCYKEKCYLIVEADNKREAREKVDFPCTYVEKVSYDRAMYYYRCCLDANFI